MGNQGVILSFKRGFYVFSHPHFYKSSWSPLDLILGGITAMRTKSVHRGSSFWLWKFLNKHEIDVRLYVIYYLPKLILGVTEW